MPYKQLLTFIISMFFIIAYAAPSYALTRNQQEVAFPKDAEKFCKTIGLETTQLATLHNNNQLTQTDLNQFAQNNQKQDSYDSLRITLYNQIIPYLDSTNKMPPTREGEFGTILCRAYGTKKLSSTQFESVKPSLRKIFTDCDAAHNIKTSNNKADFYICYATEIMRFRKKHSF